MQLELMLCNKMILTARIASLSYIASRSHSKQHRKGDIDFNAIVIGLLVALGTALILLAIFTGWRLGILSNFAAFVTPIFAIKPTLPTTGS